jgi:hypothetical protein
LNYSHSVCIARDRVEYIWTVISGQTIHGTSKSA